MKILYLTTSEADYLQDQLLTGLKNMQRVECVDYPRKDILYKNSDISDKKLHGKGFTIWKSIKEDQPPNRNRAIQRLYQGEFDLLIFSSIHRQLPLYEKLDFEKVRCPIVFLDGEDERFRLSLSGLISFAIDLVDRRASRGMSKSPVIGEPIFRSADVDGYYFKREKTPKMSRCYDIHPISFSIPKDKIRQDRPDTTQTFQTHIQCKTAYGVDEIADHSTKKPIFDTEEEYYNDLATSKYGVTMKKGGWECMRHYEIAANWAVPCFYNLDQKPIDCAPHELYDMVNCISFSSASELRRKVNYIERNDLYHNLQRNVVKWVQKNTCLEKAKYMLSTIESEDTFH